MKTIFAAAVLLLVALPAQSEVVASTDASFHIRIQLELPVPPGEAYNKFIDIGSWWDSNHTWFGDAAGLSIEPKAGGCFCERDGDRSALHMLVSYVNPGQEIKMVGGLGPLQGLGLHGAMSFRFVTVDGKHFLVHEYRVIGTVENGLKNLADVVDQVQRGQLDRLVAALSAD